jgi:hypothetical protein
VRRGLAALLLLAAFGGALPARAQTDDLEKAREESSVTNRPTTRHQLPGGELRVSPSELLASKPGQRITFDVSGPPGSRLTIRLPARWVTTPASGIRRTRAPVTRRGRLRRDARTVELTLGGSGGSFQIADKGIPAGTYRLPYKWRDASGRRASGRARVVIYARSREGPPGGLFGRLANPGIAANASNDSVNESETFVAVTQGNKDRLAVGANFNSADPSMPAWISIDAGQTWVQRVLPESIDVPASATNQTGDICCDPMFAANSAGDIWYGGLALKKGSAASRIVVNRIAAGGTTFNSVTTGLRVRTTGTQDKPMMTIDDASTSPTYGRLYVVWDEPASTGGINIVMSSCDTRVSGVLQASRCDNADNWTNPIDVTPSTGSYIYAEVAVGPDGHVYAVWWDYSSTNAIRGRVCTQNCDTAAGWSGAATQTVALLDKTGNQSLPFACPILAQPGGRASTSPQVDVDHSGGTSNGRVYVTWSDLRTGSGTTRCSDNLAPAATHLTFDVFVASAAGALPGGANTSPNVGTRLLTDGEGGGQSNSDDWFAWLAVDQTTGQPWADFYSTRDDSTRRKTNFYARSVTPSGGTSHTLGTLTKVSSGQSDYSSNPCCNFGNDYGDYTGLDATGGIAYPVWTDNSGADGEAFTFVSALSKPIVTTGTASSVQQTTATLNGTVNPNGKSTSYHFEWGTTAFSNSTASVNIGSGTSAQPVTADITGLTANTAYKFRLVATNSDGTSTGSESNFTTKPNPPAATTQPASAVGQNTATLNATINPNGAATSYHFDYGTSPGVYSQTTPNATLAAGSSNVNVSQSISGLSASTTYYFRVVASNPGGATNGSELSFQTLSPSATPPIVTTGTASSVQQTTATLNGTVNPNGKSTSYHFEWGTTAFSNSTASVNIGSGTSAQPVTADITGLTANTAYKFRLVATNSDGTSTGSESNFTTKPNPPAATTQPASAVGQNTATLNATINPNGAATSYHFDYGTSPGVYSQTTPNATLAAGSSNVNVSQSISGLSASTTYYFRVVASNPGGATNGSELNFTTNSSQSPPAVVTGAAGSISQTSATLSGTVDPNGLATTYRFDYGTTTAYGSTTGVASAGSGSSPVAVSAGLLFLKPETTYHYRLRASNSAGSASGGDRSFRTASTVFTEPASSDTTPPPMAVSRRRARMSRTGYVRVRVRCADAEPCVGGLKLYRRGRRVGSKRFTIAASTTARVRVHLSRYARQLVRRRGYLRVLGVARARDAAGNLGTARARFRIVKPRL